MKKMKKIFAVILSLAMVLGMSLTAFADPVKPAPATLGGVEDGEGITVKAYQIIKYNEAGYYEEVLNGTIDKTSPTDGTKPVLTPTADNVLALYQRLDELTNTKNFSRTDNKGDFTCADLGLGTWLVVVSGKTEYLYNPVIISVSQTANGTDYGHLNLNTDSWFDDNTSTYVKKSVPTITKTAESAETVDGSADANVVGTQYGDILKFTVTADIPGYANDGKELEYSISDKLIGLSLVKNPTYYFEALIGEDGTNEELLNAVNSAIKEDETEFLVNSLSDDFLRTHSGQKITIVYYAKVTSEAMLNVDKLNNTATLRYSTNSGTDVQEKKAETKHYTFGIDVPVNGWSESESQNPTGEFIKTHDENGDVNIKYTETPGEVVKTKEDVEFLANAEFKLLVGSENGVEFTDKSGRNRFTTDKNGRLAIAGLDDNKVYYLVETKAPSGYSINTTPIRVFIKATYVEDSKSGLQDVLTGYDVEIGGNGTDGAAITHYNYNYTEGETEFINTENNPSNPYEFKNTTLTNLPSTGGIGTTIFTIGGCAIMIIAAGLFFASRRKSTNAK